LGQFDSVRLSGHGLGRVGSGFESFSIGLFQVSGFRSGQILGYLVSGHFGFRIVLVRSGQLSGHLVPGYFEFRVVSSRIGSVIVSSSIGLFRVPGLIRSGRVGYRVI
jgi:hypothetical protein